MKSHRNYCRLLLLIPFFLLKHLKNKDPGLPDPSAVFNFEIKVYITDDSLDLGLITGI